MNKVVSLFNEFAENSESMTDNIYEAIMVIAKRARKIAADQKFEIEKILTTAEAQEVNEEEVGKDRDDMLELEKPTVIAMRELFSGELEYEYKDSLKPAF